MEQAIVKGLASVAQFVWSLIVKISKPVGKILFPATAVEKANAEGDWSAAHAASRRLRKRLVLGTCINVLVILLLMLIGAYKRGDRVSDSEKPIVGTWTFSKSLDIDSDDEGDSSSQYFEGETTFRKDRTFRETGIMKFKFVDDGEITILEYGYSEKGTWRANAKRLVETEDADDIVFKFKSASSYPKDSGDREYIASLRDIVEDDIRATLSEQDDKTTYRISKLTKNRMVLVDEDGDEWTYRRKK